MEFYWDVFFISFFLSIFFVAFAAFFLRIVMSCAIQLHKKYTVERQTKTMVARLLDSSLIFKQTYQGETGIKRDYDVCSICLVRKPLFVLNHDAACFQDTGTVCLFATYSVFWYCVGVTE
jgi:hypothetical protein